MLKTLQQMRSIVLFSLTFLALHPCAAQAQPFLSSPDGHISVKVDNRADGSLRYTIDRDGASVVLPSRLGLQLEGADLESHLQTVTTSDAVEIIDTYAMQVGKKSHASYHAFERTVSLKNESGQAMAVVFRASNDGVALRYVVADAAIVHKKLVHEATEFAFPKATRTWMQPIAVAQTGWSNTNPSYEEHYEMDVPVGTPSPSPAGWVFPALFKNRSTWLALTEADMDGNYHASRLRAEASGGVYRIGGPMPAEVIPGGELLAETDGVLRSPWRVLAIGSLQTVMESTLGTDLAAPAIFFDAQLVKPGHASWSWPLLKDDNTVYEVQKRFIDYAGDMHWNYTLIDADWDRKIGYEKVKELVDYAATKQVGILLWYNSSGSWNTTVYSPKGRLLTHEARMAEFARLREMGVKGVKIDFFAGDGQSMIAYYLAILRDAADTGLLVNFHGATLPRGWARTYPNLMSMEAVRGLEYTTFAQADEDAVATHAAMLPFARNLFDPMDFTPMVFGAIPNIKRTTRNGFELAESVLFVSGIQHFAETPQGMATVPAYVKQFLRVLPRSWDDTRFIDGVPGKYVVMARRSGASWYVAGINAQGGNQTIKLDPAVLNASGAQGYLISDGAGERSFTRRPVHGVKPINIIMKSHGGFVAVIE
ncbi:MAG TPA: glycoside hydrolase family 97 catalytic domain-containing protein [Burkholderiaceae bacterium]